MKSNHEKRVAQHLVVRSLENYIPLYTERSKWTDRSVILERPLFTGYVFVRFSPRNRISVISIPGVLHLLGDGDRDTVSAQEINRIRDGLACGHVLRPHCSVTVGTRVRMRSGVFEGVEGTVTELRQECKVIIGLSATQQCFSVEAKLRDLDVLNKVPANIPGCAVAS